MRTQKLRELIRLAEIAISMEERGQLVDCPPGTQHHKPRGYDGADIILGNFAIYEIEKPFGFSVHDH